MLEASTIDKYVADALAIVNLSAIDEAVVAAKLASSPSAAASSFNVSSNPGAESIMLVT